MKNVAFALSLIATPIWADGCPEAPDHSERLDSLIAELQVVGNDIEARLVTNQMWELWSDAPDEPSQEMLDEGMRARQSFDFLRAKQRLDSLIAYCPHYAEGYNQRAFVLFLSEQFDDALIDLDRTLGINPEHIGALAGKAMTLLALGREVEGQEVLRDAVALNPFLKERFLLTTPSGEDL